jgi:pimeloyl-ACP methyl ester carboxylesterase
MGGMSIMAYAGLHHDRLLRAGARHRARLDGLLARGSQRDPRWSGCIMALASRAPGIPPRLLVPRLVQGRLHVRRPAPTRRMSGTPSHQVQNTKLPTIGRFFYAISRHDEIDALGHFVDVPTHVIAGDDDRLIPVAHAKALLERIPHATMTELHGIGHMTTYEAPAVIAQAIVNLLDLQPAKRRGA